MKKAIAILMTLVSMTAVAAQPKAAAKKAAPAPKQCQVSMPDGNSVTVDCQVYVLVAYLQAQITQLQNTKQDKIDHDAATRAFAHKKGAEQL